MRPGMLRGLRGGCLGLTIAAVVGCGDWIVPPADSNRNVADFEAAWAWVDSVYPAFDIKQVDWDAVYAEFLPRAEAASGDEIGQVLHDMLGLLKDPHLYHTTKGGARYHPFLSPRMLSDRTAFSPQLVRRYFDGELSIAGKDGVEYGVMSERIGYIRITHFNVDGMMDDFPSVMASIRDADGLIIDVRNNTGGDHDKVEGVVRMFIDSQMAWPLAFYADQVRFEAWPTMQPYSTETRYEKPVIVLINGASNSSGELFPEVMRQLPNVTLVGDTTAGAGCSDRGEFRGKRRLPSGRLIQIPTGCICRYDGIPWEVLGIAPDIRVPQTEDDIAEGRDKQLEHAIEMLR